MPSTTLTKRVSLGRSPTQARPFDVRAEVPALAYEEHPGFQGLIADEPAALRRAVEELVPLDAALQRLREGTLVDLLFRKAAKERREKAREAYLADANARIERFKAQLLAGRPDWTDYEKETLEKFVLHMHREIQNEAALAWRAFYYSAVEKYPVDERTPWLSELRRDGCLAFKLTDDEVGRMRHLLADEEAKLRAIDTAGRPIPAITMLNMEKPSLAEFKTLLQTSLDRINLEGLASQYLRFPMKIMHVNLYLNRPQDRWWKTRYSDAGLSLPRTANMHYDSYAGMMKCMVYLNETVDSGCGPFCYIPRTHKAKIGLLHRISGKAVPYADMNLETVAQRRLFMRLPSALRNISHYGDDLLPGSELEQAYLKAERQFVTPDCNLVLFDNYGLHRGGLCETGERVALQITIMPVMFTA